MESDTALIRSDRAVELHAESSVHVNIAGVVYPRYSENDLSLRLYYSAENACFDPLGMRFCNRLQRFQDF